MEPAAVPASSAGGKAGAAEVQSAAKKAAQAATAALRAQLAKEKRRAAQLAQRAAAYKQELAYEQSMSTPTYSFQEQDHTTPYFGPGGAGAAAHHPHASAGCGAMCRLRRLVEKTRSRIDSELRAAARSSARRH